MADAPNIKTNGGIEFEGISPGGGFGITEHNTDFFAELVDENANTTGFADAAGKFAEGLRHEAGLQAHGGVPHLTFDFGLGDQGGHRVDDQNINGPGTDEVICDFEGLFPVVWLRNQ